MQGLLSNALVVNALTLLVGIAIFVGGQVIAKFLIEPLHEQRRCIGAITDALIFYARFYMNPKSPDSKRETDEDKELRDEARTVFRQRASELVAKTNAIPLYGLWQHFPRVPQWTDVIEVWKDLVQLSMGLYNLDHAIENREAKNDIQKRLRIKTQVD